MFGFWDWVGGRYSMDSAVASRRCSPSARRTSARCSDGFRAMDEHFRTTPFDKNLPVVMGLLSVWYGSFFGAETVAVLPYDQYLKRFPAYLQQLTMESNGKRVTLGGMEVDYQTGAVYWGEPGTNGQHSFYQLIHQARSSFRATSSRSASRSTRSVGTTTCSWRTCSRRRRRSRSARPRRQVKAEKVADALVPHKTFPGNRPSNVLLLEKLTPFALGSLVALYEHIVFTQGVIWDIGSFDQWGVELGKALASKIVPELEAATDPDLKHDTSTNALIKRYRAGKK